MAQGKVRSLQVRPIQSADLAFDLPGILGKQDQARAKLGQDVIGFDFTVQVLAKLLRRETNDGGRLSWDSNRIRQEMTPATLFTLRNEMAEVGLQQIIAQREIAYLQKYKHSAQIVAAVREVYPGEATTGKVPRLTELRKLAGLHTTEIKTAYESSGTVGVNKEIKSISSAVTKLTPIAMKTPPHQIQVRGAAPNSDHNVPETRSIPARFDGTNWVDITTPGMTFDSQFTATENVTKNPEFRHPFLENLIGDQRTQLDLQDELLRHKIAALSAGELASILNKELEVLDHEILKSQLSFANTFLTSPISGVVTAIYKDLGEAVQPGEPVIRVENYDRILIVGLIQHRGGLSLNRPVRITVEKIFESNDRVTIDGTLVSIRGHDSDDDEWDVIIECDNAGRRLPINFNFDRDTTSIAIS
jgi:hypothetical protein